MRTPVRTVSIPADLLDRVEAFVGKAGLGYSTPTDFIKEAIRLRLEALARDERMFTKE
jgi:Arc/MetJ-type ribon-helix-helix transcriptional regulator